MRDYGRSGEWTCSENVHLNLQYMLTAKQGEAELSQLPEFRKTRDSLPFPIASISLTIVGRTSWQIMRLWKTVSLMHRSQSKAVTKKSGVHSVHLLAGRRARWSTFGWKSPWTCAVCSLLAPAGMEPVHQKQHHIALPMDMGHCLIWGQSKACLMSKGPDLCHCWLVHYGISRAEGDSMHSCCCLSIKGKE